MKENHEMWVAKIKEEEQQKALSEKLESIQQQVHMAMLLVPLISKCLNPEGPRGAIGRAADS